MICTYEVPVRAPHFQTAGLPPGRRTLTSVVGDILDEMAALPITRTTSVITLHTIWCGKVVP